MDRPEFIYRYMSMGTDARIKYVRQIVQDGKLFFASLTQVNDPLDCKPQISIERGTTKEKREFLKRGVAKQHSGWPRKNLRREVTRIMQIDPRELDRQITSQWKPYIEGEVFICCFSSKANDLTLFGSDYGDHHRGICLEFRATDIDFAVLRQITYTNTPVTHYWFKDSSKERTEKFFFTKLKRWNGNDWGRECEWRLASDKKGHHDFPPELLTKIILGKDSSAKTEELVLSWVDQRSHPLDVCQSKLAPDDTSLTLELVKRVP